jgi:hypothetical protein
MSRPELPRWWRHRADRLVPESRKRVMKSDQTLAVVFLSVVILLSFHMSQDIVYGYDRSGPTNLIGILILAVFLYAALALPGRRSGYMILLLGSFFAIMMPVIHTSGPGVRTEVVKSSGGLFYLWTLIALGVSGAVSFVLSLQGLWRLERNVWRFLLWILVTVAAGGALFGSLIYFLS